MTDSERELHIMAGGEAKLRPLLVDFYERLFDDVMVGFFFKGKDKERLIEKELEFALRLLGAGNEYTGRPIAEAHSAHRIFGGQFARRTQILRETMADHKLPAPVRDAWLGHTEQLRAQVTANKTGECKP